MTKEIPQKTAEKEIPKTITVDVNTQSWADGYEAADKECAAYSQKPAEKYFGHTVYQWQHLAFNFIPLFLLIVLAIIWVRFLTKRQKKLYYEINEKNIERIERSIAKQDKGIENQEKTNALLQQLLEKMDKK